MNRLRRLLAHRYSPAILAGGALALALAWVWRWRVVEHATERQLLGTVDLFAYFYPMLAVASAHLSAGEMFLWNPHQMSGMPGLATLQVGFFYPPHFLYLLFPTAFCMGLMAVLHTLLAGFGLMLLARVQGLTWVPALAGACYFSLTMVLPWLQWPPGMESAAWLPLGLAAIERLGEGRDRRWLLLLVAAVAMPVLAGGYQTSVAIYYCYGLWGLVVLLRWLLVQRPTIGAALRQVVPLFVGVSGGLLFAAPQLLPTLELSRLAERSTSALSREDLIFLGNPWAQPWDLWMGLFVPPSGFFALPFFVGVVAAALSVLGVVGLRTRALPLLLLVTFGVLSLHVPEWFLDLRATLPVLGWFRLPRREIVLAKFAFSLLLAHGVREVADPTRAWSGAVLLLGVALVVAPAFLVTGGVPDFDVLVAAIGIASVGLMLAIVRRPGVRTVAVVAVLGLLAFDSLKRPDNTLELPYVGDRWRVVHEGEDIHRKISTLAGYDRSLILGQWRELKNPMLFGTYSPVDYDPLVISAFHRCMQLARRQGTSGDDEPPGPPFLGAPANLIELLTLPLRRCLDLASVSLAVVSKPALLVPEVSSDWALTRHDLPARRDVVTDPLWAPVVLRNRHARRHAYAVSSAVCGDSQDEELALAVDPSFDSSESVVLEKGDHCRPELLSGTSAREPVVRIARYEDTEVEIRTRLATPGYVVLTDSFYPGWTALVDGEPTRILRANGMFRAVRVPAGKATILFHYRPDSLYAGGALLLVGLGILIVAWRWMGAVRQPLRGLSPDDNHAFSDGVGQ